MNASGKGRAHSLLSLSSCFAPPDVQLWRFTSIRQIRLGSGLPSAAGRVKWLLTRLGIGACRPVAAGGRAFQRSTERATAQKGSSLLKNPKAGW